MILKNIPRKNFIIIPVAVIMVFLLLWLLIFRNTKDAEHVKEEFAVSEQAIDSVMSSLSDQEKIGMMLFLSADIADSTDFQLLHAAFLQYGISSCLIRTPSFDHHKQFSDSLRTTCKAPFTYAIQWESPTGDAGQLPPLQLFSAVCDSAFFSSFSESYKNLLYGNGVNCVFIPALFDSLLLQIPSLSSLNALVSSIEKIFSTDNFCPAGIIFENRNSSVKTGDSIMIFPGNELFMMMINEFGFSAWGTADNIINSQALSIMSYQHETDISRFIASPAQMILVSPEQAGEVFDFLSKQYDTDKDILDKKIKQIIAAKLLNEEFKQSHSVQPLKPFSTAWKSIQLSVAEHIACLVKNEQSILPFVSVSNISFVQAEHCEFPFFHDLMKDVHENYKYSFIQTDPESCNKFIDQIPDNKIVVFIQDKTNRFSFNPAQLQKLKEKHTCGMIDFSSIYCRHYHDAFDFYVLAGCSLPEFQKTVANLINGSTYVMGRIPVHVNNSPFIMSAKTEIIRLKESFPEDAGLDGEFLYNTIDSIISDAINRGAFPGCQVWAAKNGKVIFNKAYGWHSYDKSIQVRKTDLYDIASVTKIAATTIAAMRLCDGGKLSLNEPIRRYFRNTEINYTRIKPDTNVVIDTLNLNKVDLKKLIKQGKLPKDTFRIQDTLLVTIDSIFSKATPSLNIFTVPIRYMLMHFSGISPTLPILPFIQMRKYYLKEHNISENDTVAKTINWRDVWEMYYSSKKTDSSQVQVADGMYLKNRWLDSLWQRTKEVGVSGRKVSQYTDLNMILVQITIDTINRSNMNKYMQKEFYSPLGLRNIMYQPIQNRVPLSRIAPTENDITWRKQVIHGHVHDPSAAMLGGISGNAGLFACAEDLGVLFQMLLNGGKYGGRRYLSENIIRLFTKTNEETGRGLGFDKWGMKNIVAPSASPKTYGHTGFTGCCVWVDPNSKLVFVFLSNRVHPNVNNHRINGLKIRQKVHQVFYDAEETIKN